MTSVGRCLKKCSLLPEVLHPRKSPPRTLRPSPPTHHRATLARSWACTLALEAHTARLAVLALKLLQRCLTHDLVPAGPLVGVVGRPPPPVRGGRTQ